MRLASGQEFFPARGRFNAPAPKDAPRLVAGIGRGKPALLSVRPQVALRSLRSPPKSDDREHLSQDCLPFKTISSHFAEVLANADHFVECLRGSQAVLAHD